MNTKVILVWFRNDLRTHDNEVLLNAIQKSDFIIPVYIFDPRYYEENQFGFKKTGQLRENYIAKTVLALKHKLQSLGGDLLTYKGYPEEILPQLVKKYDVDEVYHHREVAKRETDISESLEEALWGEKRNLRHFIGHTLFHKEDLPFPIRDIPQDFNTFKKKATKESSVRPAHPQVEAIQIPPHLEKTPFPYEGMEISESEEFGEDAAFRSLENIISIAESETDIYTILSPYLAIGALSPINTYHYLTKNTTAKNKKGINALLDHLMRRDYFRFMLKKFPNCYFINQKEAEQDQDRIQQWTTASTDNDMVNSLMTKLNETGLLSEQERLFVSTYFIYELKQNWLVGAAWFEQQLIDFAPATIYGFWAHMANQGTSSKNNKNLAYWEKLKEDNSIV